MFHNVFTETKSIGAVIQALKPGGYQFTHFLVCSKFFRKHQINAGMETPSCAQSPFRDYTKRLRGTQQNCSTESQVLVTGAGRGSRWREFLRGSQGVAPRQHEWVCANVTLNMVCDHDYEFLRFSNGVLDEIIRIFQAISSTQVASDSLFYS